MTGGSLSSTEKRRLSSAHDVGVYYFVHRSSRMLRELSAPPSSLVTGELGSITGCNKPPDRHMIDNET